MTVTIGRFYFSLKFGVRKRKPVPYPQCQWCLGIHKDPFFLICWKREPNGGLNE